MGPSTAISMAAGQPATGANAAGSVSWSCFTSAGPGNPFGPAGCPSARQTTSRVLPSAASPINAPGGPTGLSASVSGSVVTLNWTAPVGGDTPTSYLVQAGSATGLSDIASFSTGSTATQLAVFNVPPGVYWVRIRAVNSAGTGGPSNDFPVVVGGLFPCTSVSPPTNVAGSVTGSTVVLTWVAPAGCAPTSYIIQAGSTSGASNLANFSTGSTATSYIATGVGSGTYYVRILSAAPALLSGPSAEIVVTVGTPAPSTIIAGFQFFDPAWQASATTSCRIVSALTGNPSTCQARSTSFTTGANGIVSYDWTVQYFYGTAKTVTQVGTNPVVSFSDTCGGPGSTDDGASQPVVVTLTVTDNLGATATVTSGTGSQPPLVLRLFKC